MTERRVFNTQREAFKGKVKIFRMNLERVDVQSLIDVGPLPPLRKLTRKTLLESCLLWMYYVNVLTAITGVLGWTKRCECAAKEDGWAPQHGAATSAQDHWAGNTRLPPCRFGIGIFQGWGELT